MQLFEMLTDDSLQSSVSSGSPEFPFISVYDEIDKYRDRCIAWHWHKEFEFSLVETGPVYCEINDERLLLREGDALFINSGTIHRFASEGGGTLQNVLFSPDFIASRDTAIFQKYIAPVTQSTLQYYVLHADEPLRRPILTKLCHIYQAAQTAEPLFELRIRNMTAHFWESFYPTVQDRLEELAPPSDHLTKARMQLMLDFIHREYSRSIQLEDVAASAGIGKSEALRCFRKSIHTTPMNYLSDYRISRACELLLTSPATVSSVALTTGFHSAGYFCRVFKGRFSQTPEEFRHTTRRP